MFEAATVAVFVVPVVLVFALGKTPLWWLAGCSVGALATYLLTTLEPESRDHIGVVTLWNNIGNVVQIAAGIALLLYAVGLLLAGRLRYTRARDQRPPLPSATVV